ncbi:hypothetical protein F52700_8045 [Fusarium sp. NRRL 52700]|nr:hypothetical protein F52700_8045 [Fusarium sp. NRRL 52700]
MLWLLLWEKEEEMCGYPEMTQQDYEMMSTLPQHEEQPQDPEREKRAKKEYETQLMLLEESNRQILIGARQQKEGERETIRNDKPGE